MNLLKAKTYKGEELGKAYVTRDGTIVRAVDDCGRVLIASGANAGKSMHLLAVEADPRTWRGGDDGDFDIVGEYDRVEYVVDMTTGTVLNPKNLRLVSSTQRQYEKACDLDADARRIAKKYGKPLA